MATVQKSLQREALTLVFWQIIITVLFSVVILLIKDLDKGLATLLGGSAYLFPNLIFAWRIFSYTGPRFSERFLFTFLLAEVSKLIFSVVIFILMVKYLALNVVFMLAGYIIAMVSFWFVCGFHFGRGSSNSKSTLSTRVSS